MEEKIWTVSEVNSVIKTVLEGALTPFWLEAEIGTITVHSSGHVYMILKDSKSQIKAVIWRGSSLVKDLKLVTGTYIEAFGLITAYEVRGEYQFSIKNIRPVGIGELQKKFEEIKKKLSEEGLFAQEIKKTLPILPRIIGVITSPTGAAIKDFLNIINRRFPKVNIKVFPVVVQGPSVEKDVIKGLKFFNSLIVKPDVIVITRGGGSTEDLWGFNSENLAREIRKSDIPVISAVGHEIDFTICDFAADLRVPTPSAAAELVALSQDSIAEKISQLNKHLKNQLLLYLEKVKRKLDNFANSYWLKDPKRIIFDKQQYLDEMNVALRNVLLMKLEKERTRLASLVGKITVLDPKSVLSRGYSILMEKATKKVISEPDVKNGTEVTALLEKGEINLIVSNKNNK